MFRKSVSIDLVEPVICLRGSSKDKQTINILRGAIRLELSHSAIVHSVTIKFVGISKTLWPEASEQQQWDKHILVDTIIPISKNPLLLKKGTHSFPFEILLSNALSESIECGLGHIRYKLLCQVHVKPIAAKRFFLPPLLKLLFILSNPILQTQKPVILIRLPPSYQQQCITQTHIINEVGGQLTLHIEKAYLIPGTLLPIIFNFNHACLVHAVDQVDVKLVERQKYKAPSKQTTRTLHHEITLPPTTTSTTANGALLSNSRNEVRIVFVVPDRYTLNVRPTTSHPHIKIRHWVQIYIRMLLKDGTVKDLHLDVSIAVLLSSMDDYITLPVYQRQDQYLPASSAVDINNNNSNNSSVSTPISVDTTANTALTTVSVPHALSSTSIASSLTSSIIKPSTTWLKTINPVKNGSSSINSSIRDHHSTNNTTTTGDSHRYSNLMMLMTAPLPLYKDINLI